MREEETILIIALILIVVVVVAVVAVIFLLGFGLPGFLAMGLHRASIVEEKPNIDIQLLNVYYNTGQIVLGIDNNSDKTYTVTIQIKGCTLHQRKTITIEAYSRDLITLKVDPYILKSGCTLIVKVWYKDRVIAYKTFDIESKYGITIITTTI